MNRRKFGLICRIFVKLMNSGASLCSGLDSEVQGFFLPVSIQQKKEITLSATSGYTYDIFIFSVQANQRALSSKYYLPHCLKGQSSVDCYSQSGLRNLHTYNLHSVSWPEGNYRSVLPPSFN